MILCLMDVFRFFRCVSFVISINSMVNWVVKVLVDVMLIFVFVLVISVRLDLCISEDFGML